MMKNENIALTDRRLYQNKHRMEPPRDRYYTTYILFYTIGTASALPGFFTTPNDYWMYKFRDINADNYTEENRTELQAQFTTTYNIVSSICTVSFIIITILLRARISVLKRLIGALFAILLLFGITVIFAVVSTDSWQFGFFDVTMITGGCLSASSSIFMVSVIDIVTRFPAHYLSAILAGQSIFGIFSALIEIISLSIGASSRFHGFIYFLAGTLIMFLTIVLLGLTLFGEFFYYHLTQPEENVERPKLTKDTCQSILNQIKYYLLSIAIVLGTSIMMNPGVTALVQSTSKGNGNKWNDLYFVPVVTFLGFNLFDWIGREVAVQILKPSNDIIVFVLSVVRIIFVPLLMVCNAQPRHHFAVVFGDVPYIIFIIIFGFSNGYLLNLCILLVSAATEPEEREISMVAVVVCMILSIVQCSFISSAIVNVL